ncbi:hypothetical protein [Geminocystis sp. GBBB08]|uniref:hypothetical protein n=1 Tax=Geminocystis sp. GBBB08 TaxID=2604140 RepID=UPI0027E26855|nr:hypothetical protein [Geminocystis sp. GBBB08]MBL1209763.1 hypothetical protein [Geminocystis sp. GBBB08]
MGLQKKYFKILLLFLSISFALSGCFNNRRSQCDQIINVSNQLAEVTQSNLATKDLTKILEIADIFDQSAQLILDKKITDEPLSEFSQKLAKIYQNYAIVTRNFITSFQNKDTENAVIYQQQVINLSQEQENLVNNINSYCQEN